MSDIEISNVLASRYASGPLRALWSPQGRVIAERRLWVTILEAQADLGLVFPEGAIDDYRAHIENVDLSSIRAREEVTRHDVKARIEEFCALAGHEQIHKGLTSRDITENVEQFLIRLSLGMIRNKTVAVLSRLATLAVEYSDTVIVGRTHNVPAQTITMGKRFADAAQETLVAFGRVESLLEAYPLRGLKGAVGTQQDLLDLFDGDETKVDRLEKKLAEQMGFGSVLTSAGQVYPRSLDLDLISALVQLSSGSSNLATTLRLMAGHDLVSEGFKTGQVGSTAMPHKTNMRTCERIGGLSVVLSGYLTMAGGLTGRQWNEGDVSDSVVRRVMLPDAFFACDGLLEATLHVLEGFTAFPARLKTELSAELPFLSTTRLLSAAVKAGMGREEAHRVVREHTLAAAQARRSGVEYDLEAALGSDPTFPLDEAQVRNCLIQIVPGRAGAQVKAVVGEVAKVVAAHPAAASYKPETLL